MPANDPAEQLQQLKHRLEVYLSEAAGLPVLITHAQPLAGGASRDMWRIDAQIGDAHERFVLRRDPPTQMNEQALTRAQEFSLMRAAFEAGVRVAKPRFVCEDEAVLGSPFFIMDYVDGVGIGSKVVRDPALAAAREQLPAQMAEQLARIHTLNPADFPFLMRPQPPKHSAAQDAIHACYAILDSLSAKNPVFEYALRWAERHAPAHETHLFCHGDFRIGNLLVNAGGLAAVADWEFAHVGDPHEELGYLCMRDWRFGIGHLRMSGISEREPFLRAYEQFSGRTVDRAAVDYWEFLGNVRWGVICLSQANRHLSGKEPSVELASLGRRSAEMQLEALRLIMQMEKG